MKWTLPLVALALMGQTTPTAAPPATAADDAEIVVTARKLSNRWKGSVTTMNGQTSCKTVKSTGDAEFDAIGCSSMLKCWPDYWPKIVAAGNIESAAGRIKTEEDFLRSKPILRLYGNFGKCVQPMIFSGIRGVLKQRRAARA